MDSEWEGLLNAFRPPHGTNGWFSPLFWPLLQAASEIPVLRQVFPTVSLNTLVVFRDGYAWKAPIDEQWPTVAVGSEGTYAVRSKAWSRDAQVLLLTEDPREAAEFLAELIAGIIANDQDLNS
ncbi:DUF6193 family natural product biosynthesis protein [Kitasatospora sp. NPDC048407]|uniref:DUF6193 family natural product biosynthesis protein n=1 Tax=Kitasatospora sp. NPDC048407 TaxID=3364051 RepID=UPI0037209009